MRRALSPTIATDATGTAAGWPVLAVAVVLILAALGAYWNSFNVPLLLDDQSSISDNPSIRQLGRGSAMFCRRRQPERRPRDRCSTLPMR